MGFDSSVFRQISKEKEMIMNKITFENKITKELLICDDIRFKRVFEGVEYISVHRPNETRQLLMRRDALQQIS
jgi:hypothetical protein